MIRLNQQDLHALADAGCVGNEVSFQLALDEALLVSADEGEIGASLRTWQLTNPTVVVGRSSKVQLETDQPYCDKNGIGIYRRCSGGAAIVAGPGCMMYSIVLSREAHPQLGKIDLAHQFVISKLLSAVQRQVPLARHQGVCDLTLNDRKFSGNALRITRSHVLYHGTILYSADLPLITKCLAHAPRQPDYRQGRDHRSFIANAPIDPSGLAEDLAQAFAASPGVIPEPVRQRTMELMSNRYSCKNWRFRH